MSYQETGQRDGKVGKWHTQRMRGNEEENGLLIKISDDIHKDEYYYFLEAK